MPIRLHDSLTREVRELSPSQPDGVFRFYNCGPTVYAPAHIGNFRTFVVNDVLRRMLDLEFGPDRVKHVRNLTDVDDKTIRRSREENRPLSEVTLQWTRKFHEDCAALHCRVPHAEPTATGHIREQVDMIQCLLDKGNAYRAPDGSVYFKVSSFPGYGALSRVAERELQPATAARAADDDEKEDGSDFALWKAWKPDDGPVKWPGPAGAAEGRPGWHIECSAMSKKHLGDTIDLHTGGVDLLFPHHENEIAQSQCCNGVLFSRHWFHSEHLLVDGKKMSKSLGNLYTLDDLAGRGASPAAVRFSLLAGHPRKQINFTFEALHAAEQAVKQIQQRVRELGLLATVLFHPGEAERALAASDGGWGLFSEAWARLCDEMNTPGALGAAFEAFRTIAERIAVNDFPPEDARVQFRAAVRFFDRALGIPLDLEAESDKRSKAASQTPPEIAALAQKRWEAKRAKDFKAADALRAELTAAGWSMLDGKDGFRLEPLKKA